MRLVSALYQRFRQLIHEGAKFCVVGGVGALVTLGGADLLRYEAGLGKYSAITVSTVAATVITFLGNRYWTFQNRQGKGASHETVTFFILNGIGLLIQYGCIALVQDAMGLDARIWYTVANFIGLVIGTLFRFWSYRRWVWRARPGAVAMAAPDPAANGHATLAYGAPSWNGHAQPSSNGHEEREPQLVPPPDERRAGPRHAR